MPSSRPNHNSRRLDTCKCDSGSGFCEVGNDQGGPALCVQNSIFICQVTSSHLGRHACASGRHPVRICSQVHRGRRPRVLDTCRSRCLHTCHPYDHGPGSNPVRLDDIFATGGSFDLMPNQEDRALLHGLAPMYDYDLLNNGEAPLEHSPIATPES